jgi:hypothetical protein
MIDRKFFYQAIRDENLFSILTAPQVDSMEAVLDYWDTGGYDDLRWLAYIWATIYHETAKTMMPIEEYGKGKGHPYGKKIKRSGIKYLTPDKIYYGRGFCQLTWYENYENMSRLLYGDMRLLKEPELALDTIVATNILFEGMTKGISSFGDFTGKCLEMYFNSEVEDWVNARRIINGLDAAKKIAGYGKLFLECLRVQ